MARRPRPVTALALALTFGALAACSSSSDPQPFAATEPPATPSALAASPHSLTPTPVPSSPDAPAHPASTTPAARRSPQSTARPINTVVPTGGLTPDMRRAIDVVRSFYLAQLAKPSKASADTMKSLSAESCQACSYDISIIEQRASTGQYTLRSTSNPSWGGLLYSLRPSTGSGLVTVRQQYVQPPLALINLDGSVVGRTKVAKVYTSLYVVDNKSGKIRSRTDVD